MVAGVATRKRPRRLDSAPRQEDDGLGAHQGEGVRGKAWQRTAASSGAARSPATGDRGRTGDSGSSCSGERRPTWGEAKRVERGDRLRNVQSEAEQWRLRTWLSGQRARRGDGQLRTWEGWRRGADTGDGVVGTAVGRLGARPNSATHGSQPRRGMWRLSR
jgi:hypothetical protein